MAKRGERRPFRVTYEWPSGISGTMTFSTREEAESAASRQESRVGLNGERCRVTVADRRAVLAASVAAAFDQGFLRTTGKPWPYGPQECARCTKPINGGPDYCAECLMEIEG